MDKRAAKSAAQKAKADFRRSLVASTEQQRQARLKSLGDIKALADQHEPMLQTSEQTLILKGQGSAELDRYINQLRGLSNHQLDTFRHRALTTQDTILGAALALHVGALPSKQRPFNLMEFANGLVGLEFEANSKALKRIALSYQKANDANLAFTRGQSSLMSKISTGIKERELAS